MHLSVGVAVSEAGAHVDGEDLLRDADIAMYQAKLAGKGRFAIFDPEAGAPMHRRHAMKEELHRALSDGQLEVHYQPIYELRSGRCVAAEALVRWRHPAHGLIGPSEFIPLAEETGQIGPIGRFVLDRSCRQAVQWNHARADAPVVVHVNLSGAELTDPGLCGGVEATLRRTGLDPTLLVLEITESRLLLDRDSVQVLERVRALGVRLALDDFGTGFSSLSHLEALPLDILKIAKPFVDRLTHDADDPFVRMISDLANNLQLEVIAEGIETEEQLRALRGIDSALGQGYLLAVPAIAATINSAGALPELRPL